MSSEQNPDFYNWNKVILPYCSGDLHAGTRNESDSSGYYFSGHLNFRALVSKLEAEGVFSIIDSIILTGTSAGGVGTTINIDYLARTVPSSIDVVAFPQAGWFVTLQPFPGSNVTYMHNTSLLIADATDCYVNQACFEALGGASDSGWDCLAANISFSFWGVRSFIAENLFDIFQLMHQDGFPAQEPASSTECDYLTYFRNNLLASLQEVIQAADGKQSGIYAPACLNHPIDWTGLTIPAQGGLTLQTLFADWYFGRTPSVPSLSNYKAASNSLMCYV